MGIALCWVDSISSGKDEKPQETEGKQNGDSRLLVDMVGHEMSKNCMIIGPEYKATHWWNEVPFADTANSDASIAKSWVGWLNVLEQTSPETAETALRQTIETMSVLYRLSQITQKLLWDTDSLSPDVDFSGRMQTAAKQIERILTESDNVCQ